MKETPYLSCDNKQIKTDISPNEKTLQKDTIKCER